MMIKETTDSPFVHLSREDNVFEIKGNSFYVKVGELYDKVLKWIEEEIPYLNTDLECNFHLNVISTQTLKKVIEILDLLDQFYSEGKNIKVNWIVDRNDNDNIEIAEDFLGFTKMPLKIKDSY